jgi:poly(3-hydroxybutyrate) depolymerase
MKILLAVLAAASFGAAAAEPLPALHAEPRDVTVSGVSSGGYMAVQFHVAHSELVKGVGAIAGGPYYCAMGSVWTALHNCMTPGAWTPLPAVEALKAATESFARAGRIDPTQNLSAAAVWLFTGTRDTTVLPAVVKELQRFYELYGAKPLLVADKAAGHAMVTSKAGNKDCAATAAPYINDCDYDAAGELLRHLLGPLHAAAGKPAGRLVAFDQDPYAAGSADAAGMADSGYLYVPKTCETEPCRVHVVFHGCRQNAAAVGEQFVRDAGYNRWADSNRLIILYPQTTARYFPIFNPRACWDWWGYTGLGYATRDGAQIRAIKAMLERLAQ